jgi:carboxyl-terminal processing protease
VISETCAVVIVAPIDGSPAEAAGLQPGDRILEVDGQSTVGETLSSLVYVVRGEEGTDVTLTIQRGEETFDVTITRGVIDLHEVSSELLDGGVGYVRLSSFTDRSTDLVREAMQSLLDDGATSFVLDLRGNPGGYIVAAQGVASQFVPEGQLLFTVESDGNVREWRAESGVAQSPDIPVVVLVDAGSASASEIVAAALQENGRATIVGQPTFGKNTVQIWNDLPNGGGLRITTDRWFTPDHNSVAPDGVQPDVVVEGPTDPTSDADPQLDRALEILREG